MKNIIPNKKSPHRSVPQKEDHQHQRLKEFSKKLVNKKHKRDPLKSIIGSSTCKTRDLNNVNISKNKPQQSENVIKDTKKYLNGLEPKILDSFIDPITKLTTYNIRWKSFSTMSPSKIDTISEEIALAKYPDVVKRYKDSMKTSRETSSTTQSNTTPPSTPNNIKNNSNDNNSISNKTESRKIDKYNQLEKIVDLYNENGLLKFLVKWNHKPENEFVPAKQLNESNPQEVIKFYEKSLSFEK